MAGIGAEGGRKRPGRAGRRVGGRDACALNLHRRPGLTLPDGRWFVNSNTTPGFLAAGSWAATRVQPHAGPARGEESARASGP